MGKTGKKIIAVLMSAAFVASFALPASAADVTLETLLKRIEKLEAENASLKADVVNVQAKQLAPAPAAAVVAAPAAPAASGNFLKTGMEIAMYGIIRGDVVMSQHDMNTSNGGPTQYTPVRPGTAGADDAEAQLTSQDTRIGFNLKAPDMPDGGKVTGKLEMDFAGSTSAGTYQPRLRLAYAQVDYSKWGFNAGQNWDVFSPLNPNTLNSSSLWRSGNIGTRHPQVQLLNKWGTVMGGKLSTKVGVLDSEDSLQEDSGLPVAQAYVGYEKTIAGVKSTFGVGGIYGTVNTPRKGGTKNDIYATTLGMTLQFTDWLAFKSEGFVGAGLNKMLGGPGYTVDSYVSSAPSVNSDAIPVRGGWMELTYNPIKKVETNLGVGIDDVRGNKIANTANDIAQIWNYNMTYYGNVKYNLTKDLLVGVEVASVHTLWLDGLKAHNDRVQSTMMLKF